MLASSLRTLLLPALPPALLCCLRSEHDALGDDDIAMYNTPEGMLAADVVPEGVYVPEVVVSKNVRKARGRMRVSAQQGQRVRVAVELVGSDAVHQQVVAQLSVQSSTLTALQLCRRAC